MQPKLRRSSVTLLVLAGCAATPSAPTARPVTAAPSAIPEAPAEPRIFAEVLGPLPTHATPAECREAPRGTCVEVGIAVARSVARTAEWVTAAVPGNGEPVVVRSRAGSGWSVALAVAPPPAGVTPTERIAFDASWTRADGPPRSPAIPVDAPRDGVLRDGALAEVQFALQGTVTSGLRSSRVVERGRPTALATIALGQETVRFTVTFAPIAGRDARVPVAACDEHLAVRLREILAAEMPARPGREVRTIELVTNGDDPAGFVCGTDATPGSLFASAPPAGEFVDGPQFAAADLSTPGSAAYLVRDAAWFTDYQMREGRVAPVVTRLRSGFVWLRDADGVTRSESLVVRSTTPRPVTLADGRTLWADVLRVEDGPRVVTTGATDAAFEDDAESRPFATPPADGR